MGSPARTLALGVAAGRVGVGASILAAPGPALRGLGFRKHDAASLTLARMAGGRDLVLGALAFAVRHDPVALRRVVLLSGAADAGDALAFAAVATRPGLRRAALTGGVAGTAAALACAVAGYRLGC